jgi:hypothetical protein
MKKVLIKVPITSSTGVNRGFDNILVDSPRTKLDKDIRALDKPRKHSGADGNNNTYVTTSQQKIKTRRF